MKPSRPFNPMALFNTLFRRWISNRGADATAFPAAQQLRARIMHTVITLMLAFGAPLHFLANSILWYKALVTHQYVLAVPIAHLLLTIFMLGGGGALFRAGYATAALAVQVGTAIVWIFLHLWLGHSAIVFSFMVLCLALPALIFPTPVLLTLGIASIVYVVSVQFDPLLYASDWLLSLGSVLAIESGFIVFGYGLQKGIDEFAATIIAHETAAVERARLAAYANALEHHHARLTFAQHDLRQPCNSILGAVEVLQTADLDRATSDDLLYDLATVTVHLRSRIDALLDEAKAPLLAAHSDLPLLDLGAVVRDHLPELERLALYQATSDISRPITITLDCHSDQMIRARKGEIQRILENLVLNAVAAQATMLTIRVRPAGTGGVELTIQDNGAGFPSALLTQPLRPFASHQGGGLGLVGVVANVHAFQGTIRLENASGARIAIQFPGVDAAYKSTAALRA